MAEGTTQKEIAILRAYNAQHKDDETLLNQAFAQACSHAKLEWVTSAHAKKKLSLDTNSIKVLNVESCKGLEFKHVFFLGLEHMPRTKRDPETERKLAYVALTRAQEYLYILASQSQGFYQDVDNLVAQYQQTTSKVPLAKVELQQSDIQMHTSMPAAKAYQPWNEDEEVELIDAFIKEELPIKEIAKRLERNVGAIRARLKKLRLLE